MSTLTMLQEATNSIILHTKFTLLNHLNQYGDATQTVENINLNWILPCIQISL